MELLSWNVNGIRSVERKGFANFLNETHPTILGLQNIRSTSEEASLNMPDQYYQYWNSSKRPGYAGTATFTTQKPLSVTLNADSPIFNDGRVTTLEYPRFYYVNAYAPVAGEHLDNLKHKEDWNNFFELYVQKLNMTKPVIISGGLGTAHENIDIFNPAEHKDRAGFTNMERSQYSQLLNSGFVDIFRSLHPTLQQFTYWSYRGNAREKNEGWRIDQFIISNSFKKEVRSTQILSSILGSDHCPIELIVNN